MFFSHDSDEARAHAQVTEGKVPLTHELIAAAASYEAAKAYAHHRDREGRPMSHQKAVELLAGFTGAYVDKYAETRGMDAAGTAQVKREANMRAEQALMQSGQY